MEIDEVSEILGLCRALMAPQHVFITDEPVMGKVNDSGSFRGLQPRARGDVIFLSKDADETTPVHETIHSQFGTEELITVPLTRIIVAKNRFVKQFPLLEKLVKKPIRYKECGGCSEFPLAHGKYSQRVRHYIRVF